MFGRNQVPVRKQPEGGGLTQPSLIDEIDVDEHNSGKDDPRINQEVLDSFNYGDQYGFPGTGNDPEAPTYNGYSFVEDGRAYEKPGSIHGTVPVTNVAGSGRETSVALNGTMAPYPIAGADWARKKVTLALSPTASTYVYVGTNASIVRSVGGDQSLLFPGQVREFTHTDDIWVCVDVSVLPAAPVLLSASIERYER